MKDAGGKLLVGLIGAGIQRSLTPAMQEEEARQHGLRLHYQLIDLDQTPDSVQQLPALLSSARIMGFAGLNITYPCKQAVLPLLDGLSPEAEAMGAVNTVVIRGGRMVGHNTDGAGWAWGFRRDLPHADMDCVVLMGAGGAGSAVAEALAALDLQRPLHSIGIPDRFIEHGSRDDCLAAAGLDAASLARNVTQWWRAQGGANDLRQVR